MADPFPRRQMPESRKSSLSISAPRLPSVFRTALCALLSAQLVLFAGCADQPNTESQNTEEGFGQIDRIGQSHGKGAKLESPGAVAEQPSLPCTGSALTEEQELDRLLDPTKAGWQTEASSDAVSARLVHFVAYIRAPDETHLAALRDVVVDDIAIVRPPESDALAKDGIKIRRRSLSLAAESQEVGHGIEALRHLLNEFPGEFPLAAGSESDHYVKFKIVGVRSSPGSDQIETPVLCEGGGDTEKGRVQWNATWDCVWEVSSAEPSQLRLKSLTEREYQEVATPENHDPWFRDETNAVLGADGMYGQVQRGVDYWVARLEGRLGVSRLGHHGLAVGDVNGDGRDDLYVCQPGGLPNCLFLTQADGTATNVAAESGVDYLDDSSCALLVDLDNDGDQDLVVVTVSGAVVLSNDGSAKFTPQAILTECRNAFSLTAADYDGDRLPDLYVGRYWPNELGRGEIAIPVPYYDAKNGGRNMLLRNAGDWEFKDVTRQVGLDESNSGFTMAASWDDVDDDGDVDLYVANDFGRNCLYRNEQGKFVNVAAKAGVEDIASGMSVSFADFDHNGSTDIYVSNMFSSAGSRITYQDRYQKQFQPDSLAKLQRMARGNTLFRNRGDGGFDDVSVATGVTMGRWAWGSLFTDINNDGWDDLVVMNGFISTDNADDL